jgi:cbb3-type cytochrome oxidase cytochrome c subunit
MDRENPWLLIALVTLVVSVGGAVEIARCSSRSRPPSRSRA